MAKLEQLQGIVMTFILIGILIGVGMTVIHQVGEQNIESRTATYASADNVTSKSLNSTGIRTSTFSLTNNSIPLGSGNYTLSTTLGTVILTDAGNTAYGGEDLTVTFECGELKAAYIASTATEDAIGDFPDWFPIIVVIIAASLIIGVVIKGFSGGKL